jgi:TonB-linked SusC/RagA family outer membrane protein
VGRHILRVSAFLALLTPFGSIVAQQPTREVTGRVTQAGTGAPIPDISVGVIGQLVGTRTNDQGEYTLRVPAAGDVSLATRAIGYKRAIRRVAPTESRADFALERDVLQLEAVTVTGQATTMESRHATSAVSTVNSEQLVRVPAPSIEGALQGKVLGAQIAYNNGAPGGGGQIQIRGPSSLLGRLDPLIVIDGVIVSNDVRANWMRRVTQSLNAGEENATNRLADINPSEIETVEILKGATASAIYGSQATNGVVVITTKRGRSGAPRFNFTQRVGTYSLLLNKGSRHFQNLDQVLLAPTVGGNPPGEAAAQGACTATSCPYYDYIGELYGRRDPSYETTVSFGGGLENTKYFVSATQREEAGIAMNTGDRRQSLRANVDQVLGRRFSINAGASMMRSYSQRAISNNDNTTASPLYAFAYTPAILNLRQKDANGAYPINPFAGGSPLSGSNPFQTFDLMKNDEDVTRIIGSGNVSYALWSNATNDVRVTVNGGVDRSSNQGYIYAPPDLQFQLPGTAAGTYPGAAVQGNGDILLGNSSFNAVWTWNPTNRWFGATTSAGLQYGSKALNDYTIILRGLVPTVTTPTGAVNTETIATREKIINQAYYVSEDFLTLNERVLLSAAVRGERSSVNGDPHQVYVFPRFGASYRFVNPIRFVDELKLRGTTGEAGNQPKYGERFVTLTNQGQIGGQTALTTAATTGNPRIRPERQREMEVGFDGAFLDERARLEVTWFNRDIRDLLVRPLLAPSSGVTQLVINGGKMRTRGTEIGLTFIPVRGRDLLWTSRATYQANKSKIVSFPPGVLPFRLGAEGGFGTAYGRLFFTPGKSTTAIYGNALRADGTVARDTVLGDATPKFIMGFTNDVSWKSWSLSTVLDWRKGGTVSNMTLNLHDEGGNTWDYDDPSPQAGVPLGQWRYDTWDGGTNTSIYLVDGSFVKVREVTLSYDLPQSLIARIPTARVHTARLSLSGRNLLMFTDYNGYDPEVNNGGNLAPGRFVDLAPFPPNRSFFFTLDLGF